MGVVVTDHNSLGLTKQRPDCSSTHDRAELRNVPEPSVDGNSGGPLLFGFLAVPCVFGSVANCGSDGRVVGGWRDIVSAPSPQRVVCPSVRLSPPVKITLVLFSKSPVGRILKNTNLLL